jgi:hypothetical protein
VAAHRTEVVIDCPFRDLLAHPITAAITRIIADHEVIFRQPTTLLIQATVFQRWRDAINGSA